MAAIMLPLRDEFYSSTCFDHPLVVERNIVFFGGICHGYSHIGYIPEYLNNITGYSHSEKDRTLLFFWGYATLSRDVTFSSFFVGGKKSKPQQMARADDFPMFSSQLWRSRHFFFGGGLPCIDVTQVRYLEFRYI